MSPAFSLDTRTIYSLGSLILWASGLIVFFGSASYTGDLRRIGRRWASAGALLGTAYAVTAFTRVSVDPLPVIFGHVFTVLATCTYFEAVTELSGRRPYGWRSYLPALVVTVSAFEFSVASPDRAHRIAVLSAVTGWQAARNALVLFRSRSEPRNYMRASAGAFALWALLLATRTAVSLGMPGLFPSSPFLTSTFEQGFLCLTVVVCVVLSFSFLIIRSERLGASLRASESEHRAISERAREDSLRDPLTNLYNRRYFEEAISRDEAQAARSGEPLAVAALDIDRFKQTNDRYGHVAGDDALLALSGVLSREVRKSDLACRMGGDEFVIVLRNTPLPEALRLGDRLRGAFAAEAIEIGGGNAVHCSISIGMALYRAGRETIKDAMRRADEALYEAKRLGGDRVASAEGREPESSTPE